MENVEQRVKAMVAEQFDIPSEISLDHRFKEDIGGDSLELVELVMAVEEEFDVEIPAEEADSMLTIRSVVDWLNQYTSG